MVAMPADCETIQKVLIRLFNCLKKSKISFRADECKAIHVDSDDRNPIHSLCMVSFFASYMMNLINCDSKSTVSHLVEALILSPIP